MRSLPKQPRPDKAAIRAKRDPAGWTKRYATESAERLRNRYSGPGPAPGVTLANDSMHAYFDDHLF